MAHSSPMPNFRWNRKPRADAGAVQAGRAEGPLPPILPSAKASMTSATGGSTTQFTAAQPAFDRSAPEPKEAIATVPNTRKSFAACTLARSSGP